MSTNDGIDVGDSTGMRVLYNQITSNGLPGQGQGILVSTSTSGTISGNTVSNNKTDGIELAISSPFQRQTYARRAGLKIGSWRKGGITTA